MASGVKKEAEFTGLGGWTEIGPYRLGLLSRASQSKLED